MFNSIVVLQQVTEQWAGHKVSWTCVCLCEGAVFGGGPWIISKPIVWLDTAEQKTLLQRKHSAMTSNKVRDQ
jgi:hypothetical protein